MVAHFGEQVVDERLVRLVLELELVLVLVLVRLVRIAMDCPARCFLDKPRFEKWAAAVVAAAVAGRVRFGMVCDGVARVVLSTPRLALW